MRITATAPRLVDLGIWQAYTPEQRGKAYTHHLMRQDWGLCVNALRGRGEARKQLRAMIDSALDGVTRPLLSAEECNEAAERDWSQVVPISMVTIFMLLPMPDKVHLRSIALEIANKHFPAHTVRIERMPLSLTGR